MAETLPHLETFVAAAEAGSFTAAARSLRLTQAAVSQRIGILEKTVGTALFERAAGRVFLTEAGQKLHAIALLILSLHTRARNELSGRAAPVSGEVTLAASTIPGEHLLPELLTRFRKHHPHIRVKAVVTDSQDVVARVEHGRAQLGLIGKRSGSPHLEQRICGGDTLVLLVPARHRWARRKHVELDELLAEPFILREVGSGSRACLEEALARAGRSVNDLRIAAELGSNEAIKDAIVRGLGLAVLSARAVKQELRSRKLRALEVTGLPLVRDIFAVWDRRRAMSIPAQLFLGLLDEARDRAC